MMLPPEGTVARGQSRSSARSRAGGGAMAPTSIRFRSRSTPACSRAAGTGSTPSARVPWPARQRRLAGRGEHALRSRQIYSSRRTRPIHRAVLAAAITEGFGLMRSYAAELPVRSLGGRGLRRGARARAARRPRRAAGTDPEGGAAMAEMVESTARGRRRASAWTSCCAVRWWSRSSGSSCSRSGSPSIRRDVAVVPDGYAFVFTICVGGLIFLMTGTQPTRGGCRREPHDRSGRAADSRARDPVHPVAVR